MASDEDLVARDAVLARVEAWRKRAPKLTDDVISMAHGAGGKASQALFEAVIHPAFSNSELDRLDDVRETEDMLMHMDEAKIPVIVPRSE